jgi:hypothetical protein
VGVFFDSVIKLEDEAPAERISSPGHPMRKQHKDALALDAHSGRFKGGEGTIYEGEDLDVPTFLRRNLPLDK